MKIVAINGSMRKGNTYALMHAVLDQLKLHNDVEIAEINVSDLSLPFCSSCHICFAKGEQFCPHSETVQKVAEQILGCDGFILSGAVYSLHLNAAAKNLIDHLSYWFHRPCLFDKKGLVVTTTAGAAEKAVAKYLASIMGHWGVGYIKTVSCKIQKPQFELNDRQQRAVCRAAGDFYSAILQNRTTAPSFESIAVHNGFRAMSAAAFPVSACDKKYWQESGMSEKIYPRKVSPVKLAVGAIAYQILKKVMDK